MDKDLKKIDKTVKQGLLIDKDLNVFLKPVFPDSKERRLFISKCLNKLKTRRMLLRAQWYIEIANDQEKIRHNRPALKVVFLIALAESIAKMRVRNNKMQSWDAISEFFEYILPADKQHLMGTFRRALTSHSNHILRFSSIIRILYDIRNKVVHGEDYYSFSLLSEGQKEQYDRDYTHFGLITSGQLGKRNRKRRVSLDASLTYEELRDIVRRTAIENIKSAL